MGQAWVEAREASRLTALSTADKAERIETLETLISHAGYIDHGPTWKATIYAYRNELRQLHAAQKGGYH
jgi:hypothetical protein